MAKAAGTGAFMFSQLRTQNLRVVFFVVRLEQN